LNLNVGEPKAEYFSQSNLSLDQLGELGQNQKPDERREQQVLMSSSADGSLGDLLVSLLPLVISKER
jgi:hypothetical protein